MPELPEVETMARGLRPAMRGYRVLDLTVHDARLLQGLTAERLAGRVVGAEVEGVDRRGKWVVISLAGHRGMIVIQPRMTGGFWLVEPPRPDHVRLTFRMDGPRRHVWFCDSRRFGKIAWYADQAEAEAVFRRAHGPDALEIALDDLARRLGATQRPVKSALMDQKLVAGIGNIYADEVLFRARVHPERRAARLSRAEVSRIHESIGSVLAEAIAAEGSSFDAGFRTVHGREGGFLAGNAVYRRTGKPCLVCGTPIVRTRFAGLANRSSHFCPKCQPRRAAGRRGRISG